MCSRPAGYYCASAVRALREPPESPMSIIAREHTAQLNAAQSDWTHVGVRIPA
jgi:hypothetical protein